MDTATYQSARAALTGTHSASSRGHEADAARGRSSTLCAAEGMGADSPHTLIIRPCNRAERKSHSAFPIGGSELGRGDARGKTLDAARGALCVDRNPTEGEAD
jgi:hypothetical protein